MAAPLIAAAVLMAMQVYQGAQQANAIRKQSEQTQKINDMNARFIEMDADAEEDFGETEIARYQAEIDKTVADQELAMTSQGVDSNYGTAAALKNETKLTGFLNQLDLRAQAQAKARGLRREASNVRLGGDMRASQSRIDAQAAQSTAALGAAQTGLSAYNRR